MLKEDINRSSISSYSLGDEDSSSPTEFAFMLRFMVSKLKGAYLLTGDWLNSSCSVNDLDLDLNSGARGSGFFGGLFKVW